MTWFYDLAENAGLKFVSSQFTAILFKILLR